LVNGSPWKKFETLLAADRTDGDRPWRGMDVISIAIENADKNLHSQADLDAEHVGESARRYPSVLPKFFRMFL